MIEKSPAFKDGGLIDITFDEGNPPFTYSGNSFNNANAYGPTLGDQPNATAGIAADAAGENIYGKNVHTEPTGPNSTLGTDSKRRPALPRAGQQLLHRPAAGMHARQPRRWCRRTACPASCAAGPAPPRARAPTRSPATPTSTYVARHVDPGRRHRAPGDRHGRHDRTGGTSPIPANTFVGTVSDTGPQLRHLATPARSSTGRSSSSTRAASPVTPTGVGLEHHAQRRGRTRAILAPGQTADPLYDATDATPGGGDTGSVLISPLIKPGTVSNTFYNHYSWLRTMEDIFEVSAGHDHAALPAGTVSGGLDGEGHLGFAAQPGLAPFGPDVFNNASHGGFAATASRSGGAAPWLPESTGGGVAALLAASGLFVWYRRGRRTTASRPVVVT